MVIVRYADDKQPHEQTIATTTAARLYNK